MKESCVPQEFYGKGKGKGKEKNINHKNKYKKFQKLHTFLMGRNAS